MIRILSIIAVILFASLAHAEDVYRGVVIFGPEEMSFKVCGSDVRWWFDSASYEATGWSKIENRLNSQPECSLRTMPCTKQVAYVSGVGKITAKGEYGHVGMYPREITFKQIDLLNKSEISECGF